MSYVYVLKLELDKYYIGFSHHIKKRLLKHFTGKGSEWTKKYKPIQVVEIIKGGDQKLEDVVTLEYVKKYGINKVRGGSYCCSMDGYYGYSKHYDSVYPQLGNVKASMKTPKKYLTNKIKGAEWLQYLDQYDKWKREANA